VNIILETLKTNPLEALKYGPIALAALTALWAAALLSIELGKPQIRRGARNMLTTFMIFSVVLTAISWTLYLFDENGKRQIVAARDAELKQRDERIAAIEKERDDQLGNIRYLLGRIDVETINKLRVENNPGGINSVALATITKGLCRSVVDLYGAVGSLVPANTCKAELQFQ
jgi:hypothetical protein